MTPAQHLAFLLLPFDPAIARQARSALAKLRKLTPGATELVYDNYRGVVVGFCPTEKPSTGILSLAIYADHCSLCFIQNGPRIPDPKKLLKGSGSVARHIKLASANDLDQPAILALIAAAKRMANVPFNPKQRRRLIIQSISAKQVSRRPAPRK